MRTHTRLLMYERDDGKRRPCETQVSEVQGSWILLITFDHTSWLRKHARRVNMYYSQLDLHKGMLNPLKAIFLSPWPRYEGWRSGGQHPLSLHLQNSAVFFSQTDISICKPSSYVEGVGGEGEWETQ